MGVEARIVLHAPDEARGRSGADAAFACIDALDAILSDWRDDSELGRLCAAAGSGPVEVSEDLYRVLERALEVTRSSGGAFDVSVAPVVREWRRARRDGRMPDAEALARARARTAASVRGPAVVLDAATRSVALAEGVSLDLGAIGKGYACDRALDVLAAHGFPSAMVELGGDLALGAPPPASDGWKIAIAGAGTRTLADCGVASSGDTEQALVDGETRYSHVLDARTGAPLTHATTFTVAARDATAADALATAASVLGRHAGRAFVTRAEDALLWVDDARFTPLFDGATLDGWTPRGGRYDGNAHWSVEDGAIVGRTGPSGAGGLLYTEHVYTAFELELEVKISYPFDSGVFVRMVPPDEGGRGAQVTIDNNPGGEIAAIYADGFLEHNTEALKRFRKHGWNHLAVRCTGFDMRLEVWLDGRLVTDYANPPDRTGFAPAGRIGLQVHDTSGRAAGSVRFRNVRVHRLPVFGGALLDRAHGVATLTPAAQAAGWTPIFNGKDLDGWEAEGTSEGYRVQDGVLVFPSDGSGALHTVADYRDFELRLDFKIAKMANSGVFLRAARGDENPTYSGCEVQILDDFNWEAVTGDTLGPTQFTGSLYGSLPPGAQVLHPPGEWNTYEILYRGSRLAVALNGHTLYDVDTLEVPGRPFAERATEGFIGMQRYGAPHVEGDASVWFRNLFLRTLSE